VHQVNFVVVGGVCAVLHGAPVATFDLDVVHSQDSANIRRLLSSPPGAWRALSGDGTP
jgi:hypothetical protein